MSQKAAAGRRGEGEAGQGGGICSSAAPTRCSEAAGAGAGVRGGWRGAGDGTEDAGWACTARWAHVQQGGLNRHSPISTDEQTLSILTNWINQKPAATDLQALRSFPHSPGSFPSPPACFSHNEKTAFFCRRDGHCWGQITVFLGTTYFSPFSARIIGSLNENLVICFFQNISF